MACEPTRVSIWGQRRAESRRQGQEAHPAVSVPSQEEKAGLRREEQLLLLTVSEACDPT